MKKKEKNILKLYKLFTRDSYHNQNKNYQVFILIKKINFINYNNEQFIFRYQNLRK